jgi:hypothetical protein
MDTNQIAQLNEQLQDKLVYVAYRAGRAPTPQAMEECRVAKEAGLPMDQYVGRFSSIRRARNGDVIITIFAFDRGRDGEGKYRAFNPSLGTLRAFEVLDG